MFREGLKSRKLRIFLHLATMMYFGICLILGWKKKRTDQLMDDFAEFQLIYLSGATIPSFLFELVVLALKKKGAKMDNFGTFFYQFTPLLNCSMTVCAGLITVIDNIQNKSKASVS